MNMPVIINSKDYEDKYGLLGKQILIASNKTTIFKASEKAKYVMANINICNPNTVDAIIKLWISYKYEPELIDIYEHNIVLKPDANYIRTNVIIGPKEILIAESSVDNVVIRLDGHDDK